MEKKNIRKYLTFITHLIFMINNFNTFKCDIVFDSYLNIYKNKDQEYEKHVYKDVANTTWKEFYITEKISNLNKAIPAYIDKDNELDLIIHEANSRLYWYNINLFIYLIRISNIRGTSKIIEHSLISNRPLKDFVIVDPQFNTYNDNQDLFILGIDSVNNYNNNIYIFFMLYDICYIF
jgi:hypothetical protein